MMTPRSHRRLPRTLTKGNDETLRRWLKRAITMVLLGLLVGATSTVEAERNPNPGVLPVGSTAFGQTLPEWTAASQKYFMEQPLDSPSLEPGCFELAGHVWVLAGGPFGQVLTVEC